MVKNLKKDLGQISVDYSCAHCALVPIALPRPATPGETSEHMRVSPFLLSFTHLKVYREQLTL
jgi:hypothetical protein